MPSPQPKTNTNSSTNTKKRPHSPSPTRTQPQPSHPTPTTSAPIHDRASTFLALFSPLPSSGATPPLTTLLHALRAHASLAGADHRIAAWRLPSMQLSLAPSSSSKDTAPSRTLNTGHNDDGERHAGARLLRLLERKGALGVCVVGRWWGGVMLGPVRFAHIERAAGEAVEVALAGGEDAEEKEGLVAVLERRDESVFALRGLLVSKLKKAGQGEGEEAQSREGKRVKIDSGYAEMSLQRLRQLEKQRDATIGFLLKRIDAAEAAAGAERREDGGDGDG